MVQSSWSEPLKGELKGASGDGAEDLAGVDRGGGSGRLGGTISNEEDLELADKTDLVLGDRTDLAQGDKTDLALGGTIAMEETWS